MISEMVGGTTFVEALLDVGGEVGEELLSEGSGPGGNAGRAGAIKSGDKREEGLEHVGRRMKSFLASGRVEASGGEGSEGVKDRLSGRFVTNDRANVVVFEEGG